MSMTSEVVDAGRAERMGLVTEVIPHERLLERAIELAGPIADAPLSTMGELKRMYTAGAAGVQTPARAAAQAIADNYDPD
jgi:enoyl-CoA hydratase/carnithine racemase